MKNILLYLAMTLTLLALTACGGGGGGTTQTLSATTYTLTFYSGGNGTLTGTTSQAVAKAESASIVTAVPATGYHFVNWTEGGNVVGTNAALTVSNVIANHTYIANFAIDPQVNKSAVLTINLTGTLPANTGIAGAVFTVTLPADVAPALTSGAVNTGVVTLSGTFADGTQTQPVYTAATASAPGTLNVTLANSVPAGITQVGEVATITLQLANGVTPTAASFGLSAVSVIDATLYNTIGGMGAKIANVTLQ